MSDQRPDRPTDPLATPDDAPRTDGDEAVTAAGYRDNGPPGLRARRIISTARSTCRALPRM